MVTISRYKPAYLEAFKRLNREWIEKYFRIEACDVKVLGDPEGEIIDKGGEIFIALDGGTTPVGCCALIRHDATKPAELNAQTSHAEAKPEGKSLNNGKNDENTRWELAKMAVDPAYQGHGTATLLATAVIDEARKRGARKIFLEANTKLAPSVHLYRKLGFRPATDAVPAYERCDLFMELPLCGK